MVDFPLEDQEEEDCAAGYDALVEGAGGGGDDDDLPVSHGLRLHAAPKATPMPGMVPKTASKDPIDEEFGDSDLLVLQQSNGCLVAEMGDRQWVSDANWAQRLLASHTLQLEPTRRTFFCNTRGFHSVLNLKTFKALKAIVSH